MMRPIIALAFAALLLGTPPPAAADNKEPPAFCVQNALAARIHVQALDSTDFKGDIPAGKKLCCSKKQCRKSATPLILMSGYIPVSNSGQAGWKSDCRVLAKQGATLRITGILEKILCSP
ncbi:hypothetical protein [Magnetococcus sp. PR-3]|uniref:hypothetical protein n=1 Tax=Magnetococcus sp. PR-3 TaxID=3120355 RepID=UPI002FCE3C6E